MKQKQLFVFAVAAALSLTGCQSGGTDPEKEAMEQQIDQLEQRITELEQRLTQTPADIPAANEVPPSDTKEQPLDGAPEMPLENAAAPDPAGEPPAPSDTSSTTYTMEELTDMVAAYEEKAGAAVLSGSASDDMEQFLNLKQEEKTIDNQLDRHEDELEYLYRNGSLSREEYKSLERELERLEDRLDAAEDRLEFTFGIDD